MSGRNEISESELHAYIDGALDEDRLDVVEEMLTRDPALAERVAAYRGDKEMLKRLYGPLIERPVPQEWLALAHAPQRLRKQPLSWRMIGSIAASLLILVSIAAYWGLRPVQSKEIVQVALEARQNKLVADRTIVAEAGGRYDSELSQAVAMRMHVPDLTKLGYRLKSIRIYGHAPNGRAAELAYVDGQNRLFTLYISPSSGKERVDQFGRGGLRVCIWEDDVLSMVMAGDMSTAAMQRAAVLAYNGLTA